MCNFNKLDNETKLKLHLFFTKASEEVGGVNYLLALLESIKKQKPHALMFKGKQISSQNSILKWNKVIFRDKVELLEEIIRSKSDIDEKNVINFSKFSPKKKLNALNMAKTLAPLEFTVIPQSHKDGEGFGFKVFESTENDKVELNPIFVAMFFCSLEFVKKALKHSTQTSS